MTGSGKPLNNKGQSFIEAMMVMGFIFLPITIGGLKWAKKEWDKTESAYTTFKKARVRLIQTQKPVNIDGISLLPLEDLDQDKGALDLDDI